MRGTTVAEDGRVRAAEAWTVFPRPVASAVVVGGALVFLALRFLDLTHHTVLLAPASPRVLATSVALGVFGGVWVAAAAWDLPRRGGRGEASAPRKAKGPVPRGLGIAFQAVLVMSLGVWAGLLAADQITEWWAFSGLQPTSVRDRYAVTDIRSVGRGGRRLDLAGPSGSLSVNCRLQGCRDLKAGDQLLVTVETGRGGVRRAVFPAAVSARPAGG